MNDSLFAVIGGPDSTRWVRAPSAAEEARALKARMGKVFWCSHRAGGCGGRLALRSGDIRAVTFAHYPGEGADCPFRHDPQVEERGYLHLALQLALQEWLSGQGIGSTLECALESGGRADLLVKAVDLSGVDQTLEVQLSPISAELWSARTARYLKSVAVVSWLFGIQVADPVIGEVCRRRGYALRVKFSSDTAHANGRVGDGFAPGDIEIGTQVAPGAIRWANLTECTLGEGGMVTPFTEQALAQREAEREKPPELTKHFVVRPTWGSSPPRVWPAEGPARALPTEPPVPVAPTQHAERPADPLVRPRGSGRAPLASWGWLSLDEERAEADWSHLPIDLRYPTAVMAHIVTRIYMSGPDWTLSFPDFEDHGLIQQALLDAGLIQLYDGSRGVRRWRSR